MNKDIEFLKELQKELKEQETDYQASPRFWVIMDYKTIPTHSDFADGHSYYHNDGDFVEINDLEELKEFVERYYDAEELIKDEFDDDQYYFSELWEWVLNNLNEYGFFGSVPIKEEPFICENTLFLTKEEAQSHLENNKHHYSKKAHTYAMTAWRSPKVEKIWNILENFNWDEIDLQEEVKQLKKTKEKKSIIQQWSEIIDPK